VHSCVWLVPGPTPKRKRSFYDQRAQQATWTTTLSAQALPAHGCVWSWLRPQCTRDTNLAPLLAIQHLRYLVLPRPQLRQTAHCNEQCQHPFLLWPDFVLPCSGSETHVQLTGATVSDCCLEDGVWGRHGCMYRLLCTRMLTHAAGRDTCLGSLCSVIIKAQGTHRRLQSRRSLARGAEVPKGAASAAAIPAPASWCSGGWWRGGTNRDKM
jgi:hypothetical protein